MEKLFFILIHKIKSPLFYASEEAKYGIKGKGKARKRKRNLKAM